MLGIYRGKPAIYCPIRGKCVFAFRPTAAGWSKAVKLVAEIRKELRA